MKERIIIKLKYDCLEYEKVIENKKKNDGRSSHNHTSYNYNTKWINYF